MDNKKLLQLLTIYSMIRKGSTTRKRGKSLKMCKPVITTLRLKSGQMRQGVLVDPRAPHIDGFLATVDTVRSNSTKYIALDAIEFFTVGNEEAVNIRSSFDRRFKVKVDESL